MDIKLTEFWCVNILNLFSCFDVATQKLISYVHIFKFFSCIGSANSGQVKQDHNSIMETIVIRMFHSYIFYWIPTIYSPLGSISVTLRILVVGQDQHYQERIKLGNGDIFIKNHSILHKALHP